MGKGHQADTVSFSVKGQIVIPRRIRKQLGIDDGTRALVYIDDGKIVLKPITGQYLRAVRGLLKRS